MATFEALALLLWYLRDWFVAIDVAYLYRLMIGSSQISAVLMGKTVVLLVLDFT